MKCKADWPEAERRLSALWYGETLDRPCIAIRAPQPAAETIAVPEPRDDEARWLDPEYRVAVVRRELQGTWWGGEAVPSTLQMARWVVCLGGTPRFSPETIWFHTREVDFTKPSPFRHDPNDPWLRKYLLLLDALCDEAGRDDFLIGQPTSLPANDLLSMMMGTTEFLMATVDHPEWLAEAIVTGARDQLAVRFQLQARLRERHDYWYGCAGWMPFWAPEPFIGTQSDVSCMLSPEAFDRFVLPELDIYGAVHNALWYHLDGIDARQHLPRLLSLPYLRVLQYTPAPCEPPNGPAHLDFYREIQRAGKIVHIELPKENVEPLVRELEPNLLMLSTYCDNAEQGEDLLNSAVNWTAVRQVFEGESDREQIQ